MSTYSDASLIYYPSGYKAGKAYSLKPIPYLGSEKVVNGDFATDSDWNKGTGVTISGGSLNFSGVLSSVNTYQSSSIEIGKRYLVTFTISNYTSGGIRAIIGSSGFTDIRTSNGTFTTDVVASGNTTIYLQSQSGTSTYSIDNVSVKEVIDDGDLTFTRASSATRVNEQGLIEGVRTNLALYSEQFDNAYWVKSNATITANSTTSPDGTTNADTFLKTSALNTVSQVSKGIITSTGTYTFSVFVKDINSENVLLRLDANGNTCNSLFTFATKTFANSGANFLSASYQELTNGWFRLMLTGNVTATNWVTAVTLFSNAINSSLYLYGFQLEQSASATEYIPTTTTAVSVGMLANVPRIDYTGGGCGKLLLEPQRTNLVFYSDDFSNGYWGANYCQLYL